MPTVEERLVALEAKSDTYAMSTADLRSAVTEFRGDVNRRFAEIQEQMNRRFEHVDFRFEGVDRRFVDLLAHMHQRFDAVDQKMDRHFTWLVGIVVGGFVTMIGTVAGAFFGFWQVLR